MTVPTRYKQVEVSGAPFEMGEQIGEALREEIRGFSAIAIERLNLTVAVSRAAALDIAARCIEFVEDYSPPMLEELLGMSRSSGVSLAELMMLQVRNQLRADADAACTSFSIAPSAGADRRALVGQNWDNDPALDPFTVVLTRRPEGEPTHMTITQAGLISYIGVSDAGIGVCLNTLPAPSRSLGVPHYFTVRGIYQADCLEEAVRAVVALRIGVSMDPFEKVAIGDTGVEVTRLGLGGAPLGGMILADGIFEGSGYDEALAIIRRAYEMGGRYFDTAPMYGDGRSEVRYGRVLGGVPARVFRHLDQGIAGVAA